MIEKYFILDESPIYKEKYLIRLNHEKIPFEFSTNGSFSVLPARLLSLTYAQYLRYCRDKLNAELIGKGKRYVIPYFYKTEETKQLVKLLNTRLAFVINERKFPYDYKQEENGEIIRTPF